MLWGGAAVGALVVALIVATLWAKGRIERRRQADVARLIDQANAAARDKQHDRAATTIDAALRLARSYGMAVPPDLARQRAEYVRRDVVLRLGTVAQLAPEEAVNTCRELHDQAENDPDLQDLRLRIDEALILARVRAARADIETARAQLEQQDCGDAIKLALATRLQTESLPPDAAKALRQTADELAAQVAALAGLVASPIEGDYFLGGPALFDAQLREPAIAALVRLGYVPPPDFPPWAALWKERAPYVLAVQVTEQPTSYLQSANRGARITARLTLTRGAEILWASTVSGQTRTPPPDMPAYEASALAIAATRRPEAERRLQTDALAVLRPKLSNALGGLPKPGP